MGERLFNATLVRRGLARSLTIPPNDRFAPRFQRLAVAAARAGRGLWGAC
jgi:endonuclease YncB( thermonuclease family)